MLEKYKKLIHNWGVRSKTFNTEIRYENPKEIPFSDALMRVDFMVDTPCLYSNEPIADSQAWEHIRFCTQLGNKVMKLREEGKEKMIEWIDSLDFNDDKHYTEDKQ